MEGKLHIMHLSNNTFASSLQLFLPFCSVRSSLFRGQGCERFKFIAKSLQESHFLIQRGSTHHVVLSINKSCRVPAIHDPNTDITLWESGAIINYLIETYDKDNKFQPTGTKEKFEAQQWLFFQVSGQGPYFGQWTWFSFFHPEKIPSAIERYANEIKRVTKVLDTALEGKEYLVENKLTYADLSFVSWYQVATKYPGLGLEDFKSTCPNFVNWMGKMFERPAIKKVFKYKASLAAAGESHYERKV